MDAISLHQYGFDCAVASLGTSLTAEHATLLSRYTEQVVLIYDGDEAGQRAAQRAIPMLEKVGLQVKVLRMKDAKDPDEFLKKFGADKFKLLLEESADRVEYQLDAIRRRYDLNADEQRVKFIQEASELICALGSPVQREVYGRRVADAGHISYDAMKLEVDKAYKRRVSHEKRKQEKQDLQPVQNLQPKTRAFHYRNVRCAMAEETVLAMVLAEPALLDKTGALDERMFTAPVLGKAFAQLRERYRKGMEVSVSVLSDMTEDEMSHIVGVVQRHQGPINETALRDCIDTIQAEYQSESVASDGDLLALQNRLRERKGLKS